MKTFAFDFDRSKEIFAFPTKREAINNGNGLIIAHEPADIAKSRVPLDILVQFYNTHTATPIKSFRDRKTAAERLMALAEAKAKIVPSAEKEKEMKTETKTNFCFRWQGHSPCSGDQTESSSRRIVWLQVDADHHGCKEWPDL
jgi:hypothetical protein